MRCEDYFAADLGDRLRFRQIFDPVLPALNVDVGPERTDGDVRQDFVENADVVDASERGHDLGSFVRGHERSAGSFVQSSHGRIGIDAHHKHRAQTAREFEIAAARRGERQA